MYDSYMQQSLDDIIVKGNVILVLLHLRKYLRVGHKEFHPITYIFYLFIKIETLFHL